MFTDSGKLSETERERNRKPKKRTGNRKMHRKPETERTTDSQPPRNRTETAFPDVFTRHQGHDSGQLAKTSGNGFYGGSTWPGGGACMTPRA
jgi:hypothetical protein